MKNVYASQELLICCGSLTAAILCSYTIEVTGFHWIPPSGAAMLLGIALGLVMLLLDTGDNTWEAGVSFEPETFFFGLLPPIIYSAGFSLKHKAFFKNFGSILLFAVVGTFVSTFVFGLATYLLYAAGMISGAVFEQPLLESLIYGALVSAVDPVATLSVFKDLNATPLLYNLVFGESVLNDAVAIVLFQVLSDIHADSNFTFATIPHAFLMFLVISLGSIAVGVLIAGATSLLLKWRSGWGRNMTGAASAAASRMEGASGGDEAEVVFSISVLVLSAYLSYLLAETWALSGIMSLFFCGICHAHYCVYNVSAESRAVARHAFHTLAHLTETFLFVYLGLQVVAMDHYVDWGLLCSGLPLCLISRATNIFPLARLANTHRRVPITSNMQVMQWACGLRGAIAYALAMNIPHGNPRPEYHAFETSTLFIVVFTTLVFGGATGPLLTRLKLNEDPDRPTSDDAQSLLRSGHGADFRDDDLGISYGHRPDSSYEGVHKLWKRLDRHLVKILRTSTEFNAVAIRDELNSITQHYQPLEGNTTSHDSHLVPVVDYSSPQLDPSSPMTTLEMNSNFHSSDSLYHSAHESGGGDSMYASAHGSLASSRNSFA